MTAAVATAAVTEAAGCAVVKGVQERAAVMVAADSAMDSAAADWAATGSVAAGWAAGWCR